MPRSRHHSTTLRRCSAGSTRPVGLDGEFSQSSAGRSGPSAVSESAATRAGAGERGADLVGRVGQLGEDDQVAGAEAEVDRQRGDQLLGADHRQHLVEAEPGDAVRAGQPVEGGLPGRRPGRSWSGSRASPRPRAAPPGRPRASGRPAYRSRGRRCRPGAPGRARPAAASLSQGKSGRREETVSGVTYSSCSCGGSAATSAWSWSISPIFAAPPGEPRSSKKWTLAS